MDAFYFGEWRYRKIRTMKRHHVTNKANWSDKRPSTIINGGGAITLIPRNSHTAHRITTQDDNDSHDDLLSDCDCAAVISYTYEYNPHVHLPSIAIHTGSTNVECKS